VGRSDSKYRWEVEYRYVYHGEHISSQYARNYSGSDYDDAQRLQAKHPVGSQEECYVNPERPDESVLRHRGPGYLLVIPFGLVLAAFGLLPMLAVRRSTPAIRQPTRLAGPISSKGKNSAAGQIVLFGIFAIIGSLFFWFLFVHPLLQSHQAMRTWREVPCTILSNRVASHRGSKSTTYSVDILYRYTFDGREHRSNRYGFFTASSGGQSAKAAIVRQFPPGRQTVCYVNPADPTDAVLRPQDKSALAWAWFPAIFFLIGVIGLLANLRRAFSFAPAPRFTSGRFTSSATPFTRPFVRADPDRPLTLRPRSGPLGKLATILIITAIWDGILCVFIWHVIDRWHRTSWPVFVFLVPFGLVGLGLLVGVVYSLLALFNPRITLRLARGAIAAGDAADLEWTFDGRRDRIQRLTIRLEGREEATYRRGTDTKTDTRVFTTLDLVETVREVEIRSGRRKLQIPAGAAPTFHATHNNVRWVLKVQGEIPRWPDLKEEFEIEVLPPRRAVPAPLTPGVSLENTGDARLSIELEGGRTSFAPGEAIHGIASWDLESPPRSLELRLFWYTRGKGTTDVGVVSAVPMDSPRQREGRAFEFRLPDCPPSFSGQLVSLIWGIELIAHPGNRSQRAEIVVAPGGQEIRLDPAPSSGAPR
jgi:hypothetical protein